MSTARAPLVAIAKRRPAPIWRSATVGVVLALGALVPATLGVGCGPPGLPASAPSPLLSKPLPDIERRAIDGTTVDTKSKRGSIVVVKFFAKYCEPCKKTLPVVERLHQSHPDVIFIGVDEDEYTSEVEEMVRTFGLTFPVIHDAANALAGRFRVGELPVTFLADGTGTIRWIGGEGQSEDDLGQAIEAVQR